MAQCYLGECLQKGAGVERNDEAAGYWYQKAADSGFKLAQDRLANLFTHFPMLKGGAKQLPPPMEFQRANNRMLEKQASAEQNTQHKVKKEPTRLPFVGGSKKVKTATNFSSSSSIAPQSAHGSRTAGKRSGKRT